MAEILSVEVEVVPIGSVWVSARNPRRGDLAVIKESLVANQQYQPVVVNRRTGEVLAGNHRVLAARELGWEEIAVCFVDVGEEQARRIMLADNRTSDVAGYDAEALIALLCEVGEDLVGTGYSRLDVDALLDSVSAEGPLEEDEIPPVPKAAVTRPGEVVELGEHRLACGDARDADLVARLMQADVADCVVTDPPYGVAYQGKTRRRLRLANDHADGLPALLGAAFGVADRWVASGAAVYVFHPTGGSLPVFVDAFVGVGWELRQSLVWAKDAMVLGHADYHFQHEGILYGYKPLGGGGRLGRGGLGWHGDNRQVS